MPQASGVRCLAAVLRAATALYAALVACDADYLDRMGLEGWEADVEELVEDLRSLTGAADLEEEG